MKYLLPLLLLLALLPAAHAQMGLNSPTGLSPRQDMEIYTRNGFMVQQRYSFTTADPNASINTLSCATTSPNLTAQAGILKDPGGDGNYFVNLNCTQFFIGSGSIAGYELVFEDLDTELNADQVIITDGNSNTLVFSGSTLPAPFFVTGSFFSVRFESNSNATVGRGFRLRWRQVFPDNSSPITPANAFGKALQFDARKGALLSGFLKTGAVQSAGEYSTALGMNNTASGSRSIALGIDNTASGFGSIALGGVGLATGGYSMVIGRVNTASNDFSIALGTQNTASGMYATAMGTDNTASGDFSTTMGYRVSTNGQKGAFMIGDSNPLSQGTTFGGAPDEFVARFLNGYYLMTSGDSNPGSGFGSVRTGVRIGRGQNSWASISDSTKKERFQPINPTDLLHKIGGMKLTTWNYKGQHTIRHYGPMAQDFYAAFGHDGLGQVGCDTLIYSHDFAGVTFAGVQALIKENEQLKAKLAQTETRLEQANARIDHGNARLEAIEALLIFRRRGNVASQK